MKTQLNLKITMTGICLLIAACLNTVQAENYTVKNYYKPSHPDWTVDGNGNKIDQPDEWIELKDDNVITLADHMYFVDFKSVTYVDGEAVSEHIQGREYFQETDARKVITEYIKPGAGVCQGREILVYKPNPDMDIIFSYADNNRVFKTISLRNSDYMYARTIEIAVYAPDIKIEIKRREPHPKFFPQWSEKQIVMQYKRETVSILCGSIIDWQKVCDIQLVLTWYKGEKPEKTQKPENMGIETVIATNEDETVFAANGLVLKSTKQYTLQFVTVDRRCTVPVTLMDDYGLTIQRSSNERHYEWIRTFTVNYDTHYQWNDIKFIFPSRYADFQLRVDAITLKESIDPETGYKVYSILGTDAKIHLISTDYPGEEKYFNITGNTGSVKLKLGDNLLTYKVESEDKRETRTQNIIVRCFQDNYNFKVDLFSPIDSKVERNDTSYIVLASHSNGYVNVSVKAEDEEITTIKCVGDLSTPLKHDETRTFTWTCKSLLTENEQRKVFVIRRKSNTVTIELDSSIVHIEGNRLIVLGTELPEITLTDPKSSYIINKDKSSITVTSEDKTVHRTYDIHYFTFDPGVIIVRVCGEVVKRNGKTYTAYVSKNSEWEHRIAVTSIDREVTVSQLTNVDKYVRSFRISKYGFVEELELVILVSDTETGINTIDSQRPYTVIDIKTGRIIKDNVTAKEAVELIKKLRTVKVIQKK
jgi:RNase P/RNase MRP subunit p29